MDDGQPQADEVVLEGSLNFPNLARHFDWNLSRILDRATFALEGVLRLEKNPEIVPGVQLPQPTQQLGAVLSLEEMRVEASAWVVAGCVRDWLEEVHAFFERTRKLCAIVTLAGNDQGRFTTDDLRDKVHAPAGEFDRLRLPKKLKFLKDNYGDVIDSRIDKVTSLIDARNCIVHGLGIVRERDITPGRQHLVVSWETMRIWVENPGSPATMVQPGQLVQPGGKVTMHTANEERLFALGGRVALTVSDLCDIYMTLKQFGYGTGMNVWNYAQTKGFHADPNHQPPAPSIEISAVEQAPSDAT